MNRLAIHDISELGLGFELDTEGEERSFPLAQGESLEVHFYLNQSLYLPLEVTVARLLENGPVRRVGAEITQPNTRAHQALSSFLKALDGIVDVAKIQPPPL